MGRRVRFSVILSSLMGVLICSSALATNAPKTHRSTDPGVDRVVHYSFPDAHYDHLMHLNRGPVPAGRALGAFVPTQSPGYDIGVTWYEYQRNGSMRRMIVAGTHPGDVDTFLVQFSWMHLPSENIDLAREYRYNSWNATLGQISVTGGVGLQADDDRGGYCGISLTGGNKAVVGGHVSLAAGGAGSAAGVNMTHIYFDFGPGTGFFNTSSRIPDSTGDYCNTYPEDPDGGIWPAFEYVEGTDDTVIHVIAAEAPPTFEDQVEYHALYYFRKVGGGITGVWDHPPLCLDSNTVLAHDLDATDSGMVGLAWVANRPCPGLGHCDTCSADAVTGNDCIEHSLGLGGFQQDNDLYYKLNTHFGADTAWLPRVNATQNVDTVDGYRPYADLSCLFTTDDKFHIVYTGMLWRSSVNNPDDTGRYTVRNRIFHLDVDWMTRSQSPITTVVNSEYVPSQCNGGGWNLNTSKMTISECRGNLYVLFVKFNDPDEPGMDNDCAYEENPGPYPIGAANGDLFISVSNDGGSTWDKARNVTNSHTPGCDSSLGTGGPCDNDHWPSMVRIGSDYTGTFPADAVIDNADLDDVPSTHNGSYLDVQYINDHSAGGIVQDEGWWQQADVKWIRIPCVDPIEEADLFVSPDRIGCPCWTRHGVPKALAGQIEGGGNVAAFWTITPVPITPASAWLTVVPAAGTVNPNQRTPLTITVNAAGTVNNPGTIVYLYGLLVVNWGGTGGNPPPADDYDTIFVECWVADTVIEPVWDTVETACTRLTVSNHGNGGHQGEGEVNLDYVGSGQDCDDSATVYLYDASPFICYLSEADETPGLDTNCYYAMFSTTWCDTNSLRPIDTFAQMSDSGDAQKYQTGVIVPATDSTVCIEKTWYAPTNTPDFCSFVVQRIQIYGNPNDTTFTAPLSVRLGEALDWDIPADSNSRNSSGFDHKLKLVYQRGSEEDGEGCQPNVNRWGGIAFLDCYKNGQRCDSPYCEVMPHGAYTHDNYTHVYPENGFHEDTLYHYSGMSGYTLSDSTNSDIHTVVTFDTLPTLTQADTFVYYVLLTTHRDGTLAEFKKEVVGGMAWYCMNIAPDSCSCCNGDTIRGNADGLVSAGGEVDIADVTYLIAWLLPPMGEPSGPAPPCLAEGNADGLVSAGGPVDIADVAYLVAYLFLGGPAPVWCYPVCL